MSNPWCLLSCATAAALPQKPHIVHIVADDLGYNDLGITNGNKTQTPAIDALIRGGVRLTSYYTFRVCSPTRASIMTGRYPWGVGFYDMSDDSKHCVDPRYEMTPALLKRQGYSCHAIGKWDVGYVERDCLPTYRGFDSFLGYYTACTSDYWMHGAPGGNASYGKCGDVDFHDSVGTSIRGAAMHGAHSLNGTYDQVAFTDRAVELIGANAGSTTPLYIYLAYHNVHDACTLDRFTAGLNAPLETVERYSTTRLDTFKLQGAMTTELDYGVANVTRALEEGGQWANSVIIFVSDNGGPLDHSSNAPLRGGKGSEWEGGYRVTAFVHSPLIPPRVAGTEWDGLAHSSDWWLTCAVGIAGGVAPPNAPAARPTDGFNLWPALTGINTTSPRVEVIHAVQNKYFNNSGGHCPSCASNVGVSSARFGDFKIIIGASCTVAGASGARVVAARAAGHAPPSNAVVPWPTLSASAVAFGNSSGWVRNGTNWAYAGLLSKATLDARADPTCATGIVRTRAEPPETGTVCVPRSQAGCTCPHGVPTAHSPPQNSSACVKATCCIEVIIASGTRCSAAAPPCIMDAAPAKGCLFNLARDPSESNNLRSDPAHIQLFATLARRLLERGATGPPLTSAFPLGEKNATVDARSCARGEATGYLLPDDYGGAFS